MQLPLSLQVKIFNPNHRIKLFSAPLRNEEKTPCNQYTFAMLNSGNICPAG